MRERGGAWVVAQSALVFLIVASSRLPPRVHVAALGWLGIALAASGAVVFVWSMRTLGRSFTMFPRPLPEHELVTRGPYALVRHPMYSAGILFFGGVSLSFSWLGVALTGALAVLWAAKARVEERFLGERFPEYSDYRRRVRRRLVPFVY